MHHPSYSTRCDGDSGSSEQAEEPLYPATTKSSQPAWWRTLFPALPEREDGEDSGPLFPTASAVRQYIALQGVRLQLLQHIRTGLTGSAASSAPSLRKYARMQLDVHLLQSVRQLAEFAQCVLELVHSCSPDEMDDLQRNNLLLLIEMMHVLRALMRRPGLPALQPDAASSPSSFISIADRICTHHGADVLLTLFEAYVDTVGCDTPQASSHGISGSLATGEASMHALRGSVLEGVLRCLHALLEEVSPESTQRVNLLRQIYMHEPSPHPPPLDLPRSPSAGSDSEILRMLILLVSRRVTPISALSASILCHIATTPVPNEHIHSKRTCGNEENAPATSPLCTRGTPPVPVITYPVHLNSTLHVASKLFVFPANPSLYLVERGLLLEWLDVLQPFLTKPALPEHTHAHALAHAQAHLPSSKLSASRSLFGKPSSPGGSDLEEDYDDDSTPIGAVLPLPSSPFLRSSSRAVTHEPNAHGGDDLHTHRMHRVAEQEFMGAQYSTPKVTASKDEEGPAHLMQFPMLGEAAMGAPAPPPQAVPSASERASVAHHRSAPQHQSNEILAAAIGGLAALATRNAAVSAYICSQPGLLSFLTSCLTSRCTLQLNLLVVKLIMAMERSLAYAKAYSSSVSGAGSACGHTPLQPLFLSQLGALSQRPMHLSRRNSEAGSRVPKLHRRNSRDVSTGSPHIAPASPSHFAKHAASPRLFALAGPVQAPPFPVHALPPLSAAEAHRHLAPLVARGLQLLLGLVRQQWGGNQDKFHKHAAAPLDAAAQHTTLALLTQMAGHSSSLQADATAAVSLLVPLLSSSALSPSLRAACLRCLASLCSLHAPNRTAVLAASVPERCLVPLLTSLRSMDAPARADGSWIPHPAILELQLVVLQLLTVLSDGEGGGTGVQPHPRCVFGTSAPVEAELVVALVSLLERDSPHKSLCMAAVQLACNLLLPHSPARDLLIQAHIVPKLAKLTADVSVWQAPQVPPLSDALDVDCATLPPLAFQLRQHSWRALCNLMAQSPLSYKREVLAELSLDGVLSLVSGDEDGDIDVPCDDAVCVAHARQLESQCWLLLRNLLEPPVEDDTVTKDDPERDTSIVADSSPLLSCRDVARVLDVLQNRIRTEAADAATSLLPAHAHLLASIAARTDLSSKSLICVRPPLLAVVEAALRRPDEACWGSRCVENLLQPSADESESATPNTPQPAAPAQLARPSVSSLPLAPLASRAQLLLDHELFQQLLSMSKLPMGGADPDAQAHGSSTARMTPSATHTTASAEVQARVTQCLLMLHANAPSSSLQSERGQLLDQFVTSRKAAAAAAASAPSALQLPSSATCVRVSRRAPGRRDLPSSALLDDVLPASRPRLLLFNDAPNAFDLSSSSSAAADPAATLGIELLGSDERIGDTDTDSDSDASQAGRDGVREGRSPSPPARSWRGRMVRRRRTREEQRATEEKEEDYEQDDEEAEEEEEHEDALIDEIDGGAVLGQLSRTLETLRARVSATGHLVRHLHQRSRAHDRASQEGPGRSAAREG